MILKTASAVILIAFCTMDSDITEPTLHWFGLLKIRPVTYRLYLKQSGTSSQLFILNPKANEIPLDTLYFENDSLHFTRDDFYSEFKGVYKPSLNTIEGQWIDDGFKKHPVTFVSVNPDTLTGIRPRTSTALTWENPGSQRDGLQTCEVPSTVSRALFDSLSFSIMREKFPNIHSVLIAKDGCLFYEDYFYGWKQDDLWLTQSVTKSFTSALIGISISKGEIKSLDESICKYLVKYKGKACNDQNQSISIRNLLTMTTGIDWNELEFDYYDERNTANQCGNQPDPFDCVLSRKKTAVGGIHFAYNSMNHLMANYVLKEAKAMGNARELRQRLLNPLGVKEVNPGNESFGVIGDIALTPRGMMKFGLLYLNNGLWGDKSIIPPQWVKESTRAHLDLGNGEGYGYFWWTKQFNVNGEQISCYYAWGYGGQYIFVVPSRNLVVTLTASNWIMDEKKYAFEMMERYILPSMML